MSEAPQGTQAVIRAIGLLKAFRPDRPEMSLGQLSAQLGLTRATAHRLLAALESEGLLARNLAQNTYHLGPAIIALGNQALLSNDLRVSVRPALEELVARSGETATLEVLTGDQMLILDGVSGKHLVSASLDIGTHWPAHLCATGRAIFASLTEADLKRTLSRRLTAKKGENAAELEVLLEELAAAKRRGYAQVIEELEPDYVAVAAAFSGPTGHIEGAVCLGGPKSRFGSKRMKELGPVVVEVASKLSGRHKGGYPVPQDTHFSDEKYL